MEKTFAIVKPDAVESRNAGRISSRFYAEHREKGFFGGLVAYMTSGPVLVAVLERENGVAHWRAVMGATDPAKADAGTIRKEFGQSIERNAVHGSANPADAAREVTFFFSTSELL